VLDIATVLANAKNRKGEDDGRVSPELLEDVARNKQENANLRDDVSAMKEIIFDMNDQIDTLKQQIEDLKAKP
jgi:predicted RNase H-like nuclease (RuvC/YqgF family)